MIIYQRVRSFLQKTDEKYKLRENMTAVIIIGVAGILGLVAIVSLGMIKIWPTRRNDAGSEENDQTNAIAVKEDKDGAMSLYGGLNEESEDKQSAGIVDVYEEDDLEDYSSGKVTVLAESESEGHRGAQELLKPKENNGGEKASTDKVNLRT